MYIGGTPAELYSEGFTPRRIEIVYNVYTRAVGKREKQSLCVDFLSVSAVAAAFSLLFFAPCVLWGGNPSYISLKKGTSISEVVRNRLGRRARIIYELGFFSYFLECERYNACAASPPRRRLLLSTSIAGTYFISIFMRRIDAGCMRELYNIQTRARARGENASSWTLRLWISTV